MTEDKEELFELEDGSLVPRFVKCSFCGSDIDRKADGMASEVDGKAICIDCLGKRLGIDVSLINKGDSEKEEDNLHDEESEFEEEDPEKTDSEDENTDSDDSEDEEDLEDDEESAQEDDSEEEEVSEDADKGDSDPKKDSIKSKLADETNDEIKDDVKWYKRKARNKVVDDPDSFKEKWRRSRMLRQDYVVLRTLSRDPDTGDVIRESTLVKWEDLPDAAVQCTNEKNYYCLDTIKTSEWYQKTRDDLNFDYYESQFTASDAALYMVSNKIDNALITHWTDFSHIDKKKIILPIAAGIAILLFFIIRGM